MSVVWALVTTGRITEQNSMMSFGGPEHDPNEHDPNEHDPNEPEPS